MRDTADVHFLKTKEHQVTQITLITMQSEMTNTSPRHMPVIGNVHPIKIENLDIVSFDRAYKEVSNKNIEHFLWLSLCDMTVP